MPRLLALAAALTTIALASPAGAERIRCGPNDCAQGETCCNYGCGICAGPGEACILPFCTWGRPTWIDAAHWPSPDVYDRISVGTSVVDQRLRLASAPDTSVTGAAMRAGVQYYAAEQTAVRAALSATQVTRVTEAPGGETLGWTAAGGLSYRLPDIFQVVGWALVVDAEYRAGPDLTDGLAPVVLTDQGITSVAAGLGFADLWDAGPVTAQVRYVQSFVSEAADIGVNDASIGVGTDLRWLDQVGGPDVPLGVRAGYRYSHEVTSGGYRSHELGGGLYGFLGDELRVGADVTARISDVTDAVDSTRIGVLLRVDWYWDANF